MASVAACQEKLPALLDGLKSNKICFDTTPEPIKDIDNPRVQEAGRFAVMEHNRKTGKKLKFTRVVNGLRQKLPFVMFFPFPDVFRLHLVVEAVNDDGIGWTYETEVLDVAFAGIMELLSFKEILHY